MIADLNQQLQVAVERNQQLEHALESRIVIEQAKGVLHERLGLTIDDAFTLLRYAARTARRPIHELAADVVATRKTPPPVIRAIAKQQQWRAALHQERNQARVERLDKLSGQVRAHQRYVEDNSR
jgi:antitoxin component of RelBE/YafQ-DinJ toxin-antitoxin module